MKKTAILALALVAASVAPAAEGVVDVQSAFGVAETADRLEAVLAQKGMTVFDRIRHSVAAGRVGIELRDTELVIFGNPKVGSRLMQCAQSVAIDLPQKALVWEDAGGRVWVSYNDPVYLSRRHGIGTCGGVVAKIQRALAGIVKAAAGR